MIFVDVMREKYEAMDTQRLCLVELKKPISDPKQIRNLQQKNTCIVDRVAHPSKKNILANVTSHVYLLVLELFLDINQTLSL